MAPNDVAIRAIKRCLRVARATQDDQRRDGILAGAFYIVSEFNIPHEICAKLCVDHGFSENTIG